MIKIDMEIPNSCGVCTLLYEDRYGDFSCPLVCLYDDVSMRHRHPNCPLIECEEGDE